MVFIANYCDKIRLERTLPHLKKEMKILDLGSGSGWMTNSLNSRNFDCVGVDIHLENNHPFYKGTADEIPFPDNSFDCLIMIEVIEHIKPSCYAEINRVLKNNGIIILSTLLPKSDPFVHFLSKIKIVDPYVTPHINLVKIETLPWTLINKSSILLLDQFGVFRITKK
jgi:ubiquinone/menaquinone biosynthesis C-methylase UbiE